MQLVRAAHASKLHLPTPEWPEVAQVLAFLYRYLERVAKFVSNICRWGHCTDSSFNTHAYGACRSLRITTMLSVSQASHLSRRRL